MSPVDMICKYMFVCVCVFACVSALYKKNDLSYQHQAWYIYSA